MRNGMARNQRGTMRNLELIRAIATICGNRSVVCTLDLSERSATLSGLKMHMPTGSILNPSDPLWDGMAVRQPVHNASGGARGRAGLQLIELTSGHLI